MRTVAVAVAAMSAALALVGGCSSFGAADGGGQGSDGGASGGGSSDGASSRGDAGPCPAPIDDAFADYGEWKPQDAGTIDTGDGHPLPSLYVTRGAGEPGRYLRRTLDPGPCTHVTVSVDLRVDALGDGEIDLFGLYETGGPARSVILTHHNGIDSTLVAEADNYDATGETVVNASGAAWYRVEIALDLATGEWTMSRDGARAASGSLGSAWNGPPDVRLGLDWSQTTVSIPWKVHFDTFHAEFRP